VAFRRTNLCVWTACRICAARVVAPFISHLGRRSGLLFTALSHAPALAAACASLSAVLNNITWFVTQAVASHYHRDCSTPYAFSFAIPRHRHASWRWHTLPRPPYYLCAFCTSAEPRILPPLATLPTCGGGGGGRANGHALPFPRGNDTSLLARTFAVKILRVRISWHKPWAPATNQAGTCATKLAEQHAGACTLADLLLGTDLPRLNIYAIVGHPSTRRQHWRGIHAILLLLRLLRLAC